MEKLRGDLTAGLLFVLLGIAFLIPSIQLGVLSNTSDGVPGAGFFPMMMSGFVILLGAMLAISSVIKKVYTDYFEMDQEQKANRKIFGITILAIAIFLAAWQWIDFFVAVAIFCLFMNKLYQRTWKFNLIYTAVFTALIYLVFEFFLKIQFTV